VVLRFARFYARLLSLCSSQRMHSGVRVWRRREYVPALLLRARLLVAAILDATAWL
jgi:hypothetical protein